MTPSTDALDADALDDVAADGPPQRYGRRIVRRRPRGVANAVFPQRSCEEQPAAVAAADDDGNGVVPADTFVEYMQRGAWRLAPGYADLTPRWSGASVTVWSQEYARQ